MEKIASYILGLNGARRIAVDARIGDHWIGVTDRGGVLTVLCEPMNDDGRECVEFTDKLAALSYIQNYVSGITDAA